MQKNKKYSKAAISLLLASVSALSFILASCVPDDISIDVDRSIIVVSGDTKSTSTSSAISIPTEDGYTAAPDIKDVKNISADVVVVGGTCEQNATVTIKGGKKDVTVKSKNGYFFAEVTLANDSNTVLEATATIDGKKESKPRPLTASYNATAEKRESGYNVSIGQDSQLYFDYNLNDYTGKNLLTQTELRKIKTFVNDKVNNIESRAQGQSVGLIYVLVPDSTSIYPECFPADTKRETTTTKYKQVAETLKQTSATVIDMYDILNANKSNAIYRKTDSRLTEYGSYLVYQQICNELAKKFPNAKARSLENEFEQSKVDVTGGDLMSYLGISTEPYVESVPALKPKFDLKIGYQKESSFNTINISDIKKYAGEKDFTPFQVKTGDESSQGENKTVGINDRFIIRTDRQDLPSALIYRDDNVFSMVDILAERFNNAMFAKSGDFTINLTDASRHYSTNKNLVDYIVVIISENNVEKVAG